VFSVCVVGLRIWEGCGIASSLILVSCFVSGGCGPTLTCVGVCFTFVCGAGECSYKSMRSGARLQNESMRYKVSWNEI